MENNKIVTLEDIGTAIIRQEGWQLEKIFQDYESNTVGVYEKAMEYASTLSAQFRVGIRPVTHNNSIYMEVYRKNL